MEYEYNRFRFHANRTLVLNQRTRVNDECPIFYYGHERRPPRLVQVAESFGALATWWAKGPREWKRLLPG